MSQSPSDRVEPQSRRPRVAKSPKRQDAKSKVKISAYLSVESARRLGIHATMTNQDRSTIIDALIRDNLRDWVVQYRPSTRGTEEAPPETEPQTGSSGGEPALPLRP
jgi:hypothetical protein